MNYQKEGKIILKHAYEDNSHTLEHYLAHEGYEALKKAIDEMSPGDVITEVMASGLRGRGGAAFPTGLKWSFVPKEDPRPRYLVVNADEGEPGTFKDRDILERLPHLLLEGALIAAYAIGAKEVFIYLRWEYPEAYRKVKGAIEEAIKAGFIASEPGEGPEEIAVHLYRGAGAYICGEETALLNSLEGKLGQPRLRPPYPATHGLYDCPTIVNNVETLANVPFIVREGADKFKAFGTEKSPGTKIFSVSGAVKKPGNYEFPLGSLTLKELIYDVAGGIEEGREILGVMPGGLSTPVLKQDELDVPLDYESMGNAGSMLGSGGVIVLDKSRSVITWVRRAVQFYVHESCGKCTPCREGGAWLLKILIEMEEGRGTTEHLETLRTILREIEGQCFCLLGESIPLVVKPFLEKFSEAFEKASMGIVE